MKASRNNRDAQSGWEGWNPDRERMDKEAVMYERMLNKKEKPTVEEMTSYCDGNGERFSRLNRWLSETWRTVQQVTFPYGNQYGWGMAHRIGKKLICNVFAEDNAFTVMVRLSDKQFGSVYGYVQTYTQAYIDHKYPCGDGGWIHYRVTCEDHYGDIQRILAVKCR